MLLRRILWPLKKHGNLVRFCTSTSESVLGERTIPIVKELAAEYGNEELIVKSLLANAELQRTHISQWKTYMNFMLLRGFRVADCLHLAAGKPSVLNTPLLDLEPALQEWSVCGKLNTDLLKLLIVGKPELLDVDPLDIRERVPFFLEYAVSREAMVHLLLLCPNLLHDDWDDIMKKITYLGDEMVVYRSEILESEALSKSLHHIKLRFTVLSRCGLYVKPSPYEHKQSKMERQNLNNPHLRRITDNSDKSFASKVAKITTEEYMIFKEMFALEEKLKSDEYMSGSDTEESDDDDDENWYKST